MTLSRPVVVMIGCETFSVRPGGLNRYYNDLASALQPIWQVRRVLPGDFFRSIAWLPGPVKVALRLALALVRTVRSLPGASVVDSHFALYGLPAAILAPVFRVPLVVHFQGPWSTESAVAGKGSPLARKGKDVVESFVYRRAAAVVVLSDAFKLLLVEHYRVDPVRVHVVRPGVDLERFVPLGEPAPQTAFAARRLEPRMGLDVAVSAWPAVVSLHPAARLRIAGAGSQAAALGQLIEGLGMTHAVELLGRVSDDALLTSYQTAQLSIVPTRSLEGFGLVAIEAMACGTPTIVTDVDALPEFMGELDGSMVVPSGDVDALARRVIEAFDGRVPSRTQCRSFAETFTWEKAARAHCELYGTLRGPVKNPEPAVPRRVMLIALEWPTSANEGGGVARLNYRIAHALLDRGIEVEVLTFRGAAPLEGALMRLLDRPSGRWGRYYLAPVRAARAVGRRPLGSVLACGDDWGMFGVRRHRLYTGSSRAEARSSKGLRSVNHWVLASLEYINSLDPSASNWTIGPDVPRRRLAAQPYPPVPGLQAMRASELVDDERRGIAFIGPPGGRKRGGLALRVAAETAQVDPSLGLHVYTARAADAALWTGAAQIRVGLGDVDLASALRTHAFLLSTSSYEGYGIPIVEALANGCVPVVTNTPGARAILTGKLAHLIGPVSEEGFVPFAVRMMVQLSNEPGAYAELQRQCVARAAEIVRDADPLQLVTTGRT